MAWRQLCQEKDGTGHSPAIVYGQNQLPRIWRPHKVKLRPASAHLGMIIAVVVSGVGGGLGTPRALHGLSMGSSVERLHTSYCPILPALQAGLSQLQARKFKLSEVK